MKWIMCDSMAAELCQRFSHSQTGRGWNYIMLAVEKNNKMMHEKVW